MTFDQSAFFFFFQPLWRNNLLMRADADRLCNPSQNSRVERGLTAD